MKVSTSCFDEWNSFARCCASTPRDPFKFVLVGRNTANKPTRDEQCADHASAPAVVEVRVADGASLSLPIQKCDGPSVDFVSPPTNRQTKLGTRILLLFGVVFRWHLASCLDAIICLAGNNQSRLELLFVRCENLGVSTLISLVAFSPNHCVRMGALCGSGDYPTVGTRTELEGSHRQEAD